MHRVTAKLVVLVLAVCSARVQSRTDGVHSVGIMEDAWAKADGQAKPHKCTNRGGGLFAQRKCRRVGVMY